MVILISMKDKYGRTIDYIRISITDRCNLRCVYCMPEEGVPRLAHEDIMTFDEILYLGNILAGLGFKKVKLTGGEPLVRKNVADLIREIKAIRGIEEVTLTSNGVLLKDLLADLYQAGLDGINVSLDTLDGEKFAKITRRNVFDRVIAGIYECLKYPQISLKLNVVPVDLRAEEIIELVSFSRNNKIHIRFIEMMPIGYGKEYESLYEDDILKILRTEFGILEEYKETLGNGPARYYSIEGFMGKIGFISAISHKFCQECNRVRLTSQGFLKTCLQYDRGVDLLPLVRGARSEDEISRAVVEAIESKPASHSFLEERIAGEEDKKMFQIGG